VAVTSGGARVASAFGRKDESALSRLPVIWALAYVVVFAIVFSKISWSLGDTYSHWADAALSSWHDTFVDAFTAREYRPFFTLGIKAVYEAVGTWLPFYQALVLLSFAALLTLVVWLCHPGDRARASAACIAVSCVCGLHTSRILFGFWPLNHYAWVMVAILLAIALALNPRTRPHDWVFALLMLVATFSLEFGLLIIPVVITLWWFRAPGVSWRGVAALLAAGAAYLAIRITFGDHSRGLTLWADTGFGFQNLSADTLRARFGAAPWVLWIYNVVATTLTVLLSEPRDGVYSFVESLLAHDMGPWQWFQVGSSALTTLVIAAGLVRGWPWKERDRQLVVAGASLLLFGSALSFVYTRDRLGLAGGVGYALLLYVACSAFLEKLPQRLAVSVVTIVAGLWLIRSAETWFQLRDTAWDYHVEWTDRFVELGGAKNSTELMNELRTTALARTPVDVRHDPAWTYFLFERRFHRESPTTPASKP
jgi:hypothetical protein